MTDLTIVIVNWNGDPFLMRCLESIRNSRCSAEVEVMVVDNHSSDGSRDAATAAFPEFTVIDSGGNLGFGRANNLARDRANSSFVLFLNPDSELREDTLERAIQCFDHHPEIGALGCTALFPDGRVQELNPQWSVNVWTTLFELLFITERSLRYLRRLRCFRRWLPDPQRSGYVNTLVGGFMMVRRDVLDAVNWFDERYFMYAEDTDLCRTILKLGWKLYYCSEAAIVHAGGGATAAAPSSFVFLMTLESTNKLIDKYHGATAAMLHRVAVLFGGLLRLSVVLVAGLVAVGKSNKASRVCWGASCLKQRQLVLWALGVKKATVPSFPPPKMA